MTLPSLLLPRSPLTVLAALAATANAVLRVAVVPIVVQPLFDTVLLAGDLAALPGVLAIGGAVVALGSLALWLQDALFGRVAAQTSARWREALYEHLLGQDALTAAQTSGGLASRVVHDLKENETYLQYGLGTLIAESLTGVGILVVLLVLNTPATLALIALIAPLALLLWWVGRRIRQSAERAQADIEAVGAHLQEGLRQLEVARAFGLAPFLLARLRPANRAAAQAQSERALWAGLQTPLAQVLGFGALAVLVALLAVSVQRGEMSLGEATAFITLLALVATPAQLLPRGYALLQQAKAAAGRLQSLLAAPAVASGTGYYSPERVTPALAFKQVAFGYPGNPPLLHRLALELRGPALVALTGDSGTGKTTLLKLLLRLLRPTSGQILLGEHDLCSYAETALRRHVAYVPQEVALFRGALRENLLLGRDYPEARLWQALEAVELASLVHTLPGGLDYPLREDGAGLSGGQRQRLMVARALLSEPAVLLLDEPTSGLDRETEQALIATLRQQARERLVVVVTHQPAVMAAADEVWALEGGTLRRLEG